jgi:tetratricopeptide (TPR) repeat protein
MPSEADTYQLAAAHYSNQRYAEAMEQLAPLLARSRANAEVLNLAAVCAYALHRRHEAECYWKRANTEHPEEAGPYNNLANLLTDQGRLDEAAKAFQRALALRPDFAQAHYNLGNVMLRLGRTDEAERHLRRAAEADQGLAQAHYNLAGLFVQTGRTQEAEAAYRQAIAVREGYAEASNNLGNLLNQLGRPDEAVAQLRVAVQIRPEWTEARLNLALALRDADHLTEAETVLRSVLESQPGHCNAMASLADILERRGLDSQAEELHRALIALSPLNADVHHNFGNLLLRRTVLDSADSLNEAERAFRTALELEPGRNGTRDNLGLVLKEGGRMSEAEALFRESLRHDPNSAGSKINLATVLMSTGRFREGWELLEARYDDRPEEIAWRTRGWSFPRWRGESLREKRLVVMCELGFGDNIQFCRYLPMLRYRGVSRVILICALPLRALFTGIEGVDICVTPDEFTAPPDADYWCLLTSLPHLFGTTLDTVPASVPYLRADAGCVARWRPRLPTGVRRIGIVWGGELRSWAIESTAHFSRRWLDVRLFAPLLELPDVSLISLQKGDLSRAQLATLPQALRPFDPMDEVTDFADTAALIESLDLVISVDTSVAHLAGALGKPVWILLCSNACWRWLDARDDSPWYPTARLFRQDKAGEWEPVIERVIEALRDQRGGYIGELRDERAGP